MQTTRTKGPTHDRHIWHYRRDKKDWKCVLCGAVSTDPEELEQQGVAADKYEKLTDDERKLAPFRG